jgi:hypothetical protein
MTPALCALLVGLSGFAADPDPEPPKPGPKVVSAQSPDKSMTATVTTKPVNDPREDPTGKAVRRLIEVRERKTGKLLWTSHSEDHVVALLYSPDGKMLASGEKGGDVYLHTADYGKIVRWFQTGLKGEGKLTFSPDSKKLTWTVGKKTKSFDVATRKQLR